VWDDELKLLMQSLGASILESQANPTGAMAMLISETVKFRDKLKEETGEVLTVGDTHAALDALEDYLKGHAFSNDLTPEQKALVQIWIDRLTMFKS